MNRIKSVLRYPGSKWRMADWIIDRFPRQDQYRVYVEPFFGSGAVFFSKEPSQMEILNDKDDRVVDFFRVCRDSPDKLANAIALTPFSRTEFLSAHEDVSIEDPVERARQLAVKYWQGIGRMNTRTGWKRDTKNRASNHARTWAGLPDRIAPAARRLKDAQIECCDAISLIKDYNDSDVLLYVDPPYVSDTRNGKMYRCEMADAVQHKALLNALCAHKGYVIVSGYPSELYDSMLKGWHRDEFAARALNNAGRTEVVWMNYTPEACLRSFLENSL